MDDMKLHEGACLCFRNASPVRLWALVLVAHSLLLKTLQLKAMDQGDQSPDTCYCLAAFA